MPLSLVSILFLCGTAWNVPAQETEVEAILARLTLEQKAMQMHLVGYAGIALAPEMRALIAEERIGGFFLQVPENFTFPEECATLVNEIQSVAMDGGRGIPLFVALDGEGGVAAPIHYMLGATPTPGNMALGASGREADAYAAYHTLGVEMRACGVNVNFAPAIDVLTRPENPDYTVRSFGGDMARNALLGRAAVRGLQDAGVIACAKHFPGLAYYVEDTHSAAPHVTLSDAELWEGGLGHWGAVIEAGTGMVMTGHVYIDAWDPDFPATCSRTLIADILRTRLVYDGVVVTDSMGMGAITGVISDKGEATIRAIVAGCDVILQVARDFDELHKRAAAIVHAVNTGRLDEERLDHSVRRILRAKSQAGLFADPYAEDPEKVLEQLRRTDLLEANKHAALNGIVVVRDDKNWLPLQAEGQQLAVICPPTNITRAGKKEEILPVGYTLAHFVKERVPGAIEVLVDTVPTDKQVAHALERVRESDILVLGQLLAHQSPGQVTFIHRILDLGKPVIIVGMGVPSDLALFPEAPAYVAANSPVPISLEAAVKVMFGEAAPGGTLPMPVGGLYAIGYPGLYHAPDSPVAAAAPEP